MPHVHYRIVGQQVSRGRGSLLVLTSSHYSLLDMRVFIDKLLPDPPLPLDLLVEDDCLKLLMSATLLDWLGLALGDYP